MVKRSVGALMALCFFVAGPNTPSHAAPFCKTLKGEWVGFGESDARKEAELRLDKALAAWGERYSIMPVKTKSRKVTCAVYLKVLDEYFCTADAVVCR
jgi:hypothetical protein